MYFIYFILKFFSKQTLAEFLSEKSDEIISYIEPERPSLFKFIKHVINEDNFSITKSYPFLGSCGKKHFEQSLTPFFNIV